MSAARERVSVTTPVGERSMTKQSFKDQCNFNLIVANYQKTGVVHGIRQGMSVYGDFDQYENLHGALEQVHAMTAQFRALPAHVRDAAGNDPVELAKMLESEEGQQQLVQAGLDLRDGDGNRITFKEPEVMVPRGDKPPTPEEVVRQEDPPSD